MDLAWLQMKGVEAFFALFFVLFLDLFKAFFADFLYNCICLNFYSMPLLIATAFCPSSLSTVHCTTHP